MNFASTVQYTITIFNQTILIVIIISYRRKYLNTYKVYDWKLFQRFEYSQTTLSSVKILSTQTRSSIIQITKPRKYSTFLHI